VESPVSGQHSAPAGAGANGHRTVATEKAPLKAAAAVAAADNKARPAR